MEGGSSITGWFLESPVCCQQSFLFLKSDIHLITLISLPQGQTTLLSKSFASYRNWTVSQEEFGYISP